MHITTLTSDEKRSDYERIHQPHQLSLEEKDELLFVLLEVLKLGVYRAQFDSSFTVITSEE